MLINFKLANNFELKVLHNIEQNPLNNSDIESINESKVHIHPEHPLRLKSVKNGPVPKRKVTSSPTVQPKHLHLQYLHAIAVQVYKVTTQREVHIVDVFGLEELVFACCWHLIGENWAYSL